MGLGRLGPFTGGYSMVDWWQNAHQSEDLIVFQTGAVPGSPLGGGAHNADGASLSILAILDPHLPLSVSPGLFLYP